MRELLIDFITTLDGYASGDGWPGWWGLEGPEYLAWLGEQPPVTYLMGANTYRLMSSFAGGEMPPGIDELPAEEEASVDELTRAPKVVFSASLEEPLTWANTTLVRGDAVQAVQAMKEEGSGILSTLGSISLCRSLLEAGLVDRFRVVVFPVITGSTGRDRCRTSTPGTWRLSGSAAPRTRPNSGTSSSATGATCTGCGTSGATASRRSLPRPWRRSPTGSTRSTCRGTPTRSMRRYTRERTVRRW